jgi:hypothetical protein
MLSVCCLSGEPRRLAVLRRLLRSAADDVVVAVDDRADLRLLDWFGVEASAVALSWRADAVYSLPAGRRRDRLRLEWQARRLRRHARR